MQVVAPPDRATSPRAGQRPPRGAARIAAVILLLLAFGIRVSLAPDYDLGMDGGVSVTLALLPSSEVLDFSARDVHPPLYYLLLKAWLRLAGISPFTAKYPTILAGVLLVAAVWAIGRRIGGPLAATVAAGLIALGATPVGASVTVRDLAFGMAIAVLALALFLRAMHASNAGTSRPAALYGMWLGVGALNALAIVTSYAAGPVILAQAIAFLLYRPRRWKAALAGVSLAVLLVLPWLVPARSSLAAKAVGQESQRPPDAPVVGFGEYLVRELALVVTGEFGEGRALTTLVVSGLIVLGVVASLRSRDQGVRVGTGAVAIAALLCGAFVFGAINLWLAEGFAARYGFVALPFLALLVGAGVTALGSVVPVRSGRGAVSQLFVGVVLAVVLGIGTIYGLDSWHRRPPLPESFWEPRALVAYLDRVAAPGDAIVFTTPEQSGYYAVLSRLRLPWRHFTIGAAYLTDDVTGRSAALFPALAAQHERVWVVLYQSGLPGTEPIREWLARNWWLAGAEWVPDSQVLELRTAGEPAQPIEPIRFAGHGGTVALTGLGLPASVQSGEYLPVSLEWRVDQPTDQAQTVFVHLIGPDGQRYGQRDAQPGIGLWPFDVMDPGSVVPDRHAIAIPPDAPAGSYALQIGLYAGDQRMESSAGGTAYQISGIEVRRE